MNEIQAAAERVRRVKRGEFTHDVYPSCPSTFVAYRDDLTALADAYLQHLDTREREDDVAVDEAWLRSVCHEAFAHHVVFGPPEKLVTVWKSQMGTGWCVAINGSLPIRFEAMTRKHVNEILSGLDITINKGA